MLCHVDCRHRIGVVAETEDHEETQHALDGGSQEEGAVHHSGELGRLLHRPFDGREHGVGAVGEDYDTEPDWKVLDVECWDVSERPGMCLGQCERDECEQSTHEGEDRNHGEPGNNGHLGDEQRRENNYTVDGRPGF